jgi:hypothetical protein
MDYDPVSTDYLPEGLTDGCCLTAILYTTVGRIDYERQQISRSRSALYQQAISRLRKRIADGSVQDHTICAVAILLLYEYFVKAQGADYEAHCLGMQHLLDARGGLFTLDNRIHTKILKTLLIPAADKLARPAIPYIRRNRPPIAQSLGFVASEVSTSRIESLIADFHPVLYDGFSQLHRLAGAINLAIKKRCRVHPYALDYDIIAIQHQQLCLDATECSDYENSVRLAILAFTRILIRPRPFEGFHCLKLTNALLKACTSAIKINSCSTATDLKLWILVMGALVAQNTIHRSWFFIQVITLAKSKGLTSKSELCTSVADVIWIPKVLDQHLLALNIPFLGEDEPVMYTV